MVYDSLMIMNIVIISISIIVGASSISLQIAKTKSNNYELIYENGLKSRIFGSIVYLLMVITILTTKLFKIRFSSDSITFDMWNVKEASDFIKIQNVTTIFDTIVNMCVILIAIFLIAGILNFILKNSIISFIINAIMGITSSIILFRLDIYCDGLDGIQDGGNIFPLFVFLILSALIVFLAIYFIAISLSIQSIRKKLIKC